MAGVRRTARHLVLGVISDTHGLVRPAALVALRGTDAIIHAGDIGGPDVLPALASLGPVHAIRGNNDTGAWARRLPATLTLRLGHARVHVVHNRRDLALDLAGADIDAVISGHSHRPAVEQCDGVLYLNPGSAGPRRFRLPVAVARLHIGATGLRAEIIPLDLEG